MAKNILHVFSGEYRMGNGIFTVLDALFNIVDSERFNCTLYVAPQKKEEFNYRVIYSNDLPFRKLLAENEFDLVIFHGLYFLDYYSKSILCLKKNIPFLFKPHGGLVKESLKKSKLKKLLFIQLGLKYILNKSNGIIYINSEEEKNSIDFKTNTYIEPNLVFLNSTYKKINSDKIRYLFFSRIDFNHKGLDILLEALKEIPRGLHDKFYIDFYGIGDEKSIDKLKKIITDENLSFVKYKGPVTSPSERTSMFSNSDILILTSRYEGYPTVITEALTFGIPPIVTPGTNAVFLSENGIGWKTELNSSDIAKTIQLAFRDYKKKHEEISLRCKSFVEANFRVDENIKLTQELYTEITS